MPKIVIDGTEIEVAKGTTVIQAAEKLGIEIPRYCYHPGLSIVGVCRICLVEIERMPKLQVACYTPVTDGMVVHTNTEKVLEARQAVLEFLLVNHPLDCPVCDQAGECWLQNFYMEHGRHDSSMVENKNKKQKALPIGPNVMLDSERCILCSRCVRFCNEISKTDELGIFNRGDRAELLPYPGQALDNKYSANTIDICPVGALTDRDFRFRTRVWYLSETKSICPGCSTGCNIYVHHNDKRPYKAGGIRVSRLKPRYHPDVNEWWMCDEGRYGFTYVDAPSRFLAPTTKVDDQWHELSWEEAFDEIASKISGIVDKSGAKAVGVLLSPQMTNEDLFAGKRLFKDILHIENIESLVAPLTSGSEDEFLIKADKNPNTRGCQNLNLSAGKSGQMTAAKMLQAARDNKLKLLYICHHDLEIGFPKKEIERALKNVELVIFQGSNENSTSQLAHYCLPSATFVEKDGTFTNHANRIQRIHQAVEPIGESKPDWQIFKGLAKKLGCSLPFFEIEDIFRALAETEQTFNGYSYYEIGEH
ncbi:MAG: molybdopterin-dependent oxidoreductase, partial [bacterium]